MTDQRNLDSETLSIYGYSGDLMSEDNQISQWGMCGSVYNWEQNMVYYKIDTNGGPKADDELITFVLTIAP